VDGAPTYLPDRFYVLSDAGSVYCDAEAGADGFESPQAAAEWARRQTGWQYGSELDFSDGVTSTIALGAELNANAAVWEEWDGRGDWPDAPGVHNYARDLGLVTRPEP
jgi:hypothetical protein